MPCVVQDPWRLWGWAIAHSTTGIWPHGHTSPVGGQQMSDGDSASTVRRDVQLVSELPARVVVHALAVLLTRTTGSSALRSSSSVPHRVNTEDVWIRMAPANRKLLQHSGLPCLVQEIELVTERRWRCGNRSAQQEVCRCWKNGAEDGKGFFVVWPHQNEKKTSGWRYGHCQSSRVRKIIALTLTANLFGECGRVEQDPIF